MRHYWSLQKLWYNETVAIIGGGPSLKGFDLSPLKGRARVITLNNAWELVDFNDMAFFADMRWWRWNGANIPKDYVARLVTVAKGDLGDPRIFRVRRSYDTPITKLAAGGISGPDSGSLAMNLAYHLGASRIILLGIDMQFQPGAAHWHPEHPVAADLTLYQDKFIPWYGPAIAEMAKANVEVVRCTPSALGFIPEMSLEEALNLPPRRRSDLYSG